MIEGEEIIATEGLGTMITNAFTKTKNLFFRILGIVKGVLLKIRNKILSFKDKKYTQKDIDELNAKHQQEKDKLNKENDELKKKNKDLNIDLSAEKDARKYEYKKNNERLKKTSHLAVNHLLSILNTYLDLIYKTVSDHDFTLGFNTFKKDVDYDDIIYKYTSKLSDFEDKCMSFRDDFYRSFDMLPDVIKLDESNKNTILKMIDKSLKDLDNYQSHLKDIDNHVNSNDFEGPQKLASTFINYSSKVNDAIIKCNKCYMELNNKIMKTIEF